MKNIETELQSSEFGEVSFRFPATHTQQAFWYLDRLERGNPAWNIAVRFELKGNLDPHRLEAAINVVVNRHESLRTTFDLNNGEPVQAVHDSAIIPLPVDDISSLPEQHRDVIEEELTIAEGEQRFDLAVGPLIRARLLKLEEARHTLLITVHHIIADGWSIGILSDEITTCYQNTESLHELPLQFADYAIWHRDYVESETAGSINYWRQQLADLPLCEITPDLPRSTVKANNGYILSTLLPEQLITSISKIALDNQTTLYVAILSALKLLIARYNGQQDICIGTQFAGRNRTEFERIIGVFVNTAILRTELSPRMTFTQLLTAVSHTFEGALQYAEVPYANVIASLHTKFDRSRHIGYSINFIYQRDFVQPREFDGITMTPLPSKSPGAIYDLNFFMVRRASGWRLSCEYDSQLYLPTTITTILDQLQSILSQVIENPCRLLNEFCFDRQ